MKTPKAESHCGPARRRWSRTLGLAIAEGTLAPNSILRLDELEAQHSVSRSVVREAARVLSSKGMLESRRRLGTVVQPEDCWNLYDPQVIRWRLASSKRLEQLQALNELRGAIEPQAARLAAERASLGRRQRPRLPGGAALGCRPARRPRRIPPPGHRVPRRGAQGLRQRHVFPAAQPGHRGPHRPHRARPDAAPSAPRGTPAARGRGQRHPARRGRARPTPP